MTTAVKRACDACHRRKVKCDGINPCRNCSTAQLGCTYNAIPQKKGPKGSRAKVISELRETQRQTSLSAKVLSRMNGVANSPSSPSLLPTPGLLTPEVLKECTDFFFANMYGTMPILERRQIEQQAMYAEQNRDAYCLLTSLCAFMMLQPGMAMPAGDPYNLDAMPGATIVSCNLLLEETVRVRKGYEYLDSPTHSTLCANFFLFACYAGMEMHDKAWYYLREATTMMQILNMHKEETYLQWEPVEQARRRRLYWLMFATERAYAIQRQRPITLQATIKIPSLTDDPSDPQAHQLNAFLSTVRLFQPLDDAVISQWTKVRGNMSQQYLSTLQKQVNELVPQYLCQDAQLADLGTNQQWLKSTVWQLTSHLNGNDDESGMSFQFRAGIARDLLVNMADHFPGQGVELFGSQLIEKLLEVGYTLTDVLSLKPASRDPFAMGPREHLNQVLNVVALLRHGDLRFLPLLMSKVGDILPRIMSPMLQNAPENSNLGSIDIFDGFGNAGMAQPPSQMQMQIDTEYDRKFSVAEYDKMSAANDSVSSAGSTGASSVQPTVADMSSQFVSSPAIMSPGMDFAQGLDGFACTPLSDMVMSPLPQGSSMNQGNPNPQQPQHHSLQTLPSSLPSQSINSQQLQANMSHGGLGQQSQNLGGISPHGLPMQTSHPGLGGGGANTLLGNLPRQQPQRANSFAMQAHGVARTVGDFHALQRANSDLASMGSLGAEMDFSSLR